MIERMLKQLLQFPTQFFLLVIGGLLFIPFIGNVHLFDWDEINFAESAREMLVTGNWRMVQINFEPFYEKPPLFIWLQAISMQYFGVNEFAARLPNAICGMATMLVVFNAGRNVFSSQLGVLWAMFFAASLLPHLYFKSGIIDPVFNLFIFMGLFFMYKTAGQNEFEPYKVQRSNKRWFLLLSALFIGLATLTKGPVAILLTVLTATTYIVVHRGRLKIELGEMILWWVIVSIVVVAWLSFEVRANGIHFIDEFITYQIRLFKTEDAGHGGPWFYHWVIVAFGVFPASALMVDSFRKSVHDNPAQQQFKRWMIYLMMVVLVVFSIVKTKIVHYSSLTYFPITFLAAYYTNHLFNKRLSWTWRQTVPVFSIALTITLLFIGGIFVILKKESLIPYIKDEFAVANLQAVVHWSKWDALYGAIYLIAVVICIALIQTKHVKWAVYVLLISTTLFISTLMTLIVPRVEKYSQAALIEFLESKQDENCMVETAGFKSYAHLFYARRKPPIQRTGKETVYVVTKVHRLQSVLESDGRLIELYRKNGWVFLRVNDLK